MPIILILLRSQCLLDIRSLKIVAYYTMSRLLLLFRKYLLLGQGGGCFISAHFEKFYNAHSLLVELPAELNALRGAHGARHNA